MFELTRSHKSVFASPTILWQWKELQRFHNSGYFCLLPCGGSPWDCNAGVWQDRHTKYTVYKVYVHMAGLFMRCLGTPTTHPFLHSVSHFSSQLSFLCPQTYRRTNPDNGRLTVTVAPSLSLYLSRWQNGPFKYLSNYDLCIKPRSSTWSSDQWQTSLAAGDQNKRKRFWPTMGITLPV